MIILGLGSNIGNTLENLRRAWLDPKPSMIMMLCLRFIALDKYGLGTTIWSPLASGILSGKYNQGIIPKDSRLAKEGWLVPENFMQLIDKTKKLSIVAQELDCSLSQLAIAWCLKNPNVSTVITGATNTDQLLENLGASEVKPKLTEEIMKKIKMITAE